MRRQVGMTLGLAIFTAHLMGCDSTGPKAIGSYWPGQKLPDKCGCFSWPPAARQDLASTALGNEETDALIRGAIERGFQGNGYTIDSGGRPDFWVRYRIAKEVKQAHTGQGAWDEADFAIDVIDPPTSKLIWCGTYRQRIDYSTPPEMRRERIEKAVRSVLKKFPTRKTA